MQIITTPQELQRFCLGLRARGKRIALVPTMGAFHAGHESLMRAAAATDAFVTVSLFVNPTQFGPNEDLAAYPRDTERDIATARAAGANLLFMPEPGAMYAPDHGTWVEVPELARTLCGASRPTHFRGVCTVVLKLFMLVQPHIAFFGEKDRQQLIILQRMARDLNVPVEIRGCPIVREPDGLALSSRNAYLAHEERAQAPQLHAGLLKARAARERGERRTETLRAVVREHWAKHLPLGQEDYLSIVDVHNLQPVDEVGENALLAAAVRLGGARLIDNILL